MEKVENIDAELKKMSDALSNRSILFGRLNPCIQNFNLFPSRKTTLRNNEKNNVNTSYLIYQYVKEFNLYASTFNSAASSLKYYYQNISNLSSYGNAINNYCAKPNKIRTTVKNVTNLASRDNEVIDLMTSSWKSHVNTADDRLQSVKKNLSNINISNGDFDIASIKSMIDDVLEQLSSLTGTVNNAERITVTEVKF